jgi:microcystin-dependent protein
MEGTIAEIRYFGGNFNPRGWMLCQGQILSIAQNTALFALIGTIYGGDGQVTFGIPDFRSRWAVGTGQGPGLASIDLGEMAGVENTTILTTNLPAHSHTLSTVRIAVNGTNGDTTSPNGSFIAANQGSFTEAAGANQFLGSSLSGTLTPSGSGTPISIRNPYLGLNVIICIEGIFPSRN